MIALARTMLRAFVSDRGALLLAFLAPVAFLSMFAVFFRHLDSPSGVTFDVVVTAPAGNADAERLVRTIVAAPHGRIHAWASAADVPDGRADAFVELDAGFTGARPRVVIRSESPLPGVGDAVREVVRAAVADAFHDGAASVEVDDRSAGGALLGESASGIAVMFALFSCSSLALRGLVDDGAGFGDRLRSMRIGRLRRVGARLLVLAIIACVQLAWTFLFAAVAFGVVPASPAALAAAVCASAAAIAGTVVAVAALCRTRARFAAVSPVVTLVLSGLGGSMVPLVLMPPALAWPARGLFSAWAIEACSAGLRAGPSMAALAMLTAWTVAMLLVASAAEPESQA